MQSLYCLLTRSIPPSNSIDLCNSCITGC